MFYQVDKTEVWRPGCSISDNSETGLSGEGLWWGVRMYRRFCNKGQVVRTSKDCYCSVTKLCPTLCNCMSCSVPDFPVHCLLEFGHTYVPWAGDAIQTSHPQSPPSPALSLSQHQHLFPMNQIFKSKYFCARNVALSHAGKDVGVWAHWNTPLIHISALWDQGPVLSHPESSRVHGGWVAAVSDGDGGSSGSVLSLLLCTIRVAVVTDGRSILCLWTWQRVFFIHNCIAIFIIFLLYFTNHVRIFF